MTIKFVTAAALAATMSTAAFASGASVGADANAGGAGADAAVSAEANTGMGASSSENASGLSQGNLMAELKNGQANSASWSSQIAALGDDATVNIVSLSELKGESAENSAALESEMSRVQSDAEMARTAIEENAHVAQALEDENYSADDVVLVSVQGANEVTLIVDDMT
ncbi:hypothetical protein [Albibacillus kandeliae]|uniref:hypothetical protein n=1 Tax=Albibacillus kandeliae TaxID=2174228 RepID=UPI0013006EC2|nr:hypothetical protein [Albibacillus kandeliae]